MTSGVKIEPNCTCLMCLAEGENSPHRIRNLELRNSNLEALAIAAGWRFANGRWTHPKDHSEYFTDLESLCDFDGLTDRSDKEKMTLVERLNNPARGQNGALSESVTQDMRDAAREISALTAVLADAGLPLPSADRRSV